MFTSTRTMNVSHTKFKETLEVSQIRMFWLPLSGRWINFMIMSFNELLEELPGLTLEQRQLLVRRALELDDLPLSAADESPVEQRLAEHHRDPGSSLPSEKVKERLRS